MKTTLNKFILISTIIFALFIAACSGGWTTPSDIHGGAPQINIAAFANSNISVNESSSVLISLSKINSPVTLSITNNNPSVISVSPSDCYLTPLNTSCTINTTGLALGRGTFSASAPGYTTQTSESLSVVYQSIYSFKSGTDGAGPQASLIESNGILYSTTYNGGESGNGTVFSINPLTYEESVIYSFGTKGLNDGAHPAASLFLSGSIFYGTTQSGGESGNGTAFSINLFTNIESMIYSFGTSGESDGVNPYASFIESNGVLYSTTLGGGYESSGTIFKIDLNNGNAESVIHYFGYESDGAIPAVALLQSAGIFYGTTANGGGANCNGCGTVFKIDPNNTESYQVIHDFSDLAPDGNIPEASLLSYDGFFYSTTYGGGAKGFGTIFEIDSIGNESVVYSFESGSDGAIPSAQLIPYHGLLYGTTNNGGPSNSGVVFSFDPISGSEEIMYSFKGGTDGQTPTAALLEYKGILYGTTSAGGESGAGTVFAILPSR